MAHTYHEKVKLARAAKVGDTWTNIKTGRTATIIERRGMDVKLKHEGGRVTWKQDHYFAGDFDPGVLTVSAPKAFDNFDYCVSLLRKTAAKVRTVRKKDAVVVRVRADLLIDFTPSQKQKGGGAWCLRGSLNSRFGIRNLLAYITAHGV